MCFRGGRSRVSMKEVAGNTRLFSATLRKLREGFRQGERYQEIRLRMNKGDPTELIKNDKCKYKNE